MNTWWQDVRQALQEGMDPIEKGVTNGFTVFGMGMGFLGGGAGGGMGGSFAGPVGTAAGGYEGAMAGAAAGGTVGRGLGIGLVGLSRILQGTIHHFANGGDGAGGTSGAGDSCPSEPGVMGRRGGGKYGGHFEVEPGTNPERTINGRRYSGHAQDRMQGRGYVPSVIEDAIQTGKQTQGRLGRQVFTSPEVQVVVSPVDGGVITVIPRSPK